MRDIEQFELTYQTSLRNLNITFIEERCERTPDGVHFTVFTIYMPLVYETGGLKNTSFKLNGLYEKPKTFIVMGGWVRGFIVIKKVF